MAQHFLLSAAARSLSFKAIGRSSDDEAHVRFVAIRFAENGGAPFGQLREAEQTRPLLDDFSPWPRQPLDKAGRIARAIRTRFGGSP